MNYAHIRRSIITPFIIFIFTALAFAQTPEKYEVYKELSSWKKRGVYHKFTGAKRVWWAPDGVSYIVKEGATFKRVSAEDGSKSSFFDDAKIINAYNKTAVEKTDVLPFKSFKFVHNNTKISFSDKTRVYFYTLASGELKSFIREPKIVGVRNHVYHEVFSKDLKHRAYARDYNLYLKDSFGREKALTKGGHKDLRKGFPDWVYPEELDQYNAFWWSPNSDKIAYMQFDESPVYKYPIVHDIDPQPYLQMQSYPKAGENNPIVKMFIVDIKTGKNVEIDSGDHLDVYLIRGKWSTDGKEFYYQRLNRVQNKLDLLAANPETGKSRLIFSEKEEAYINLNDDMTFLKDGKRFIWTSERSGYKEIYLYDISGKLIRQITNKKLPVASIKAVDEEHEWIYFTGYETRGLETHLYRVKFDGSGFKKLTKKAGTHRVSVSPTGKYFTDSFTSFNSPTDVSIYKTDGRFVRTIGSTEITDAFKKFKLKDPEHVTFPAADGKTTLDGMIYYPADFDKNIKYPLILSVYGGPAARMIRNTYYKNGRSQALAQLGFIVFTMDHRGVARRGKKFETQMYMKLGQIEVDDHAAGAQWMAKREYVDGNRVGIYGHSYGGYLTIMALLKKPEIFHVGVSGAPVTDWKNYDSVYTERYMRRPKDNPDGYAQNSAMLFANNLKGKLAIHHGTIDDNVHPGNTIQIVDALLKQNKKFDLMMYPRMKHGIYSKRYRASIVEYFVEHLKP